MRRRRREPVAALAPFVPVDGTVADQWAAWESWEEALKALDLPADDVEAVIDESLPVMPDGPFDPQEI